MLSIVLCMLPPSGLFVHAQHSDSCMSKVLWILIPLISQDYTWSCFIVKLWLLWTTTLEEILIFIATMLIGGFMR
jgi:hypothetical protein